MVLAGNLLGESVTSMYGGGNMILDGLSTASPIGGRLYISASMTLAPYD
jgi:hypothetical protein